MRNRLQIGVLLACLASLGGCVEAMPNVAGNPADFRALAPSPASRARIALATLDGAPDAVQRRFDAAFQREAKARELTVVAPESATYLVRGYLSAASENGGEGTSVTFVYDIFDAAHHARVDRVADTLTLPTADGDAWAPVDDRVVDSLAGRSADRLTQALAALPDAPKSVPASPHPGPLALN